MKMLGKIVIDTERCKGCGLCVTVCPKGCIVISKRSNKSGYFPAEPAGPAKADCTGCAMCAIICPDAVIDVYRDDDTSGETGRKRRSALVEDKTQRG